MEKIEEISVKSTKNEILQAYNELLKKAQGEKPVDRQAEKKKEEEREVVRSASQHSIEKIVKGLAEIKLEIGKSFDNLEEQLVTQYKKLSELQQAIGIETKRLEEIHEIKVNADSLAALLMAQKEKKAAFESEIEQKKEAFETGMAEKRLKWEKEQAEFEAAKKEREEKIKKERQREEEEYTYTLQLKRKKDKDQYEAQKAALEKELAEKKDTVEKALSEREAAVGSKEKEFAELKARVEVFPAELDKAVKTAEKAVTERLGLTYKHSADLAAKEIEGERKLYKQTVTALEAKIKENEAQIKELNQRSKEAGLQVQDIAVKAIEGASAQRILSMNYEKKGSEPPKGQ